MEATTSDDGDEATIILVAEIDGARSVYDAHENAGRRAVVERIKTDMTRIHAANDGDGSTTAVMAMCQAFCAMAMTAQRQDDGGYAAVAGIGLNDLTGARSILVIGRRLGAGWTTWVAPAPHFATTADATRWLAAYEMPDLGQEKMTATSAEASKHH